MLKEAITELSKTAKEPEWMLQKRLEAFSYFENLPTPSFVYGIGIFFRPESLNLNELNIKNENELIAVADKKVTVVNFKNASENDLNLIKQHFATTLNPNENKFTALHLAAFNNATLIHIPDNTTIYTPIQINLSINSNSLDHLLIIAGKNSKASILTSITSSDGSQKFRSEVVEIIADENSNLDFISIQNLNKESHNFSIKRAVLNKDAVVNWLDCCLGSKFTKAATTTNLNAQGAKTNNIGIFFGDKTQNFDINNTTIHNSPFTKCNMLTKGVLNDKAKTVYRGLIKIQPNAHDSDSYQKEDTLLIGKDAEADAVPILEIHNDKVKCSHGTTIGQIDSEKLFYLMSRGLDEYTAKTKIVEGFFESIINKIPSESTLNSLKKVIQERLTC